MNEIGVPPLDSLSGRVVSLHLHPENAGGPMHSASTITLESGKGIVENSRYFAKRSRDGSVQRRQVSLIEREVLEEHASALLVPSFPAGAVRSNIETSGFDLAAHVQCTVQIGTVILFFYAHRDPCSKMEAVAPGLMKRMLNGRQGVLAQVVQGGLIRVGDTIELLPEARPVT